MASVAQTRALTLLWQGVSYTKERFEIVHDASRAADGVLRLREYVGWSVHAHRCVSLGQFKDPIEITHYEGH